MGKGIRSVTLLVLMGLLMGPSIYSQTQSGDLEGHLNSLVTALPSSGGNDYVPPTPSELLAWEQLVADVLNGNILPANAAANSLGYDLTQYTDTGRGLANPYYLLEEKLPNTKYWGVYAFNPNACRDNLVVQAPHPRYDSKTGSQAIFCFTRLSAKALFLSGTHRCNHDSLSSCSGTTGACGSSGPFRISDMAHNDNSIFHATTKATSIHDSASVFVQLHGFSMQASDPFVILSNGSRDTPTIDYCARIRDGLLLADTSLTFKIGHIDLAWTRLLAFTNTQGRYLNNSANPCSTSATNGTGRFIHMEQERTQLRADSTGWNKVFHALEYAFTCTPPVGLEDSKTTPSCFAYPNPNRTGRLKIDRPRISELQLVDLKGILKVDQKYSYGSATDLDVSGLSKGIYFLRTNGEDGQCFQKVLIQ